MAADMVVMAWQMACEMAKKMSERGGEMSSDER